MMCENAYHESDEYRAKLCCKCERKLKEDDFFKERCPLVYWCPINERYENTADMFNCIYREKNNEKNDNR